MATVATFATPRKPAPKAFYAHLDDQHGVLTQDAAGAIWFRNSESQALTLITPEQCNFLAVHGEVGLADTQQLMDRLHHGYAAIACSRNN